MCIVFCVIFMINAFTWARGLGMREDAKVWIPSKQKGVPQILLNWAKFTYEILLTWAPAFYIWYNSFQLVGVETYKKFRQIKKYEQNMHKAITAAI